MQEYNRFELENELKKHMYRLAPTCILASNSMRRKELLERLGVKVFTSPSRAKEFMPPTGNPSNIVKHNAVSKVASFEKNHSIDEVVYPIISADTVVSVDFSRVKPVLKNKKSYAKYNSYILGKPRDKKEALTMLGFLREAKVHRVYTGIYISIYHPFYKKNCSIYAEDYADVVFKDGVSNADLLRYIEETDVLSAAGSYRIQCNGDALFSAIYGDITTIEGLSYTALYKALQEIDKAFKDEI